MTALMDAALDGNRESVDTLLRLGADPDILASYGRPALHMAIQAGDLALTERLAQITSKGEAQGGKLIIIRLVTAFRIKPMSWKIGRV